MAVSSRFFIGVVAWLLGAVTATAGSMIAVNQLAHGLLEAQAQQFGGTTLSADLDPSAGGTDPAPIPSATATRRPSRPMGKVSHSAGPSPGAMPSQGADPSQSAVASQSPGPSPTGTLLVSADGSVMASCQSAGAYLLYWSPDQGYVADDVQRGPAATASVTFRGPGGVVMHVVCSGGTPIAHVYPVDE